MKRITILSRRTPRHPQSGGAAQYAHEIFRRLSNVYDITVLGEGSGDSPRSEMLDGVTYVNLRGPLARFQIAFSYVSKYSRNTDLLIDHADVAVPWLSPIFSSKPRVTIVHQMVKEIYYYQLRRPLADLGFLAEKAIYGLYARSRIVTSSGSAAQELEELGIPHKSVSVIAPGYSSNRRSQVSLSNRERAIVCVGRLMRYKGLQYALQAFRRVLADYPEAIFRIAGTGPYREELERLSQTLEVDRSVQFLGHISQDEKFDLLAKSRASVFPSVRDGFGISVIEANSVGTPVVAWNVPGPRDSVIDQVTGLLSPFPDDRAFANNLSSLLSDDNLWSRLSDNAQKLAANFSWDKSAADFGLIAEAALDKQRAH